MTKPYPPSLLRTRRLRARHKREGAALLIVLFVLMMATGTAVFALQSTQLEQRAAGSLQLAMRTKYVSEAATNGVLALCLEYGTTGCVDMKHATNSFNGSRERYGLPSWGQSEVVSRVSKDDILGSAWTAPDDVLTQTPFDVLLPSDAILINGLAPTTAIASPFRPTFETSIEKWTVTDQSDTRFRLVISTYGLLGLDPQTTLTNNATTRAATESISATRAFFDVR